MTRSEITSWVDRLVQMHTQMYAIARGLSNLSVHITDAARENYLEDVVNEIIAAADKITPLTNELRIALRS